MKDYILGINNISSIKFRTNRCLKPGLEISHKAKGIRLSPVKFCFPLFLVFLSFQAHAQEISAKASAPKYDFLVGDRINVLLEIKRPANFSVEWQKQEPAPGEPELADTVSTDSTEDARFVTIKIHVPLAAFDSGQATYPAQVFIFHKTGSPTPITLKTEPLVFHISTISVDLKKDPKPIIDPVDPGLDVWKFVEQLLVILVIGGVALFILFRWLGNRKKEKQMLMQKPLAKRPPSEIAMEKLNELSQKDLIAKGQVKAHYISLSNIVRQYVADIFKVDAMELSTEELTDTLAHGTMQAASLQKLSDILELSDSVKFAKYVPDQSDHQRSMEAAEGLVREENREIIPSNNPTS